MASVSAQLIKSLRERTGVSINKCKEALLESNGDIEEAISFLRKSGAASASKKADRETKEGAIFSAENESYLALVEINAETDFVVKNENFQSFGKEVACEVLESDAEDAASLLTQKSTKDSSLTVDDMRASIVQTLGENIQIKRLLKIQKNQELSLASYSHMQGKIVSCVVLQGDGTAQELAKDLAMHVAAEAPDYLNQEQVPEDILNKEREIAKTQALSSGKPEHILDKIVEGKMQSFFDQFCLLRQKYIKDSKQTVSDLVRSYGKEKGKELAVQNFVRWQVGSSS